MAYRTNNTVTYYQSLSEAALAGEGAVLVALRAKRLVSDAQLKAMNQHDRRNHVIAMVNAHTSALFGASRSVSELQRLNDHTLAKFYLGGHR